MMEVFSLAERRLRADSINAYNNLKGIDRGEEERLLSAVSSDKTRHNGLKLKHRRFLLKIRKTIVTVRVDKQWKRLPREAVGSPSLEIF